jgi:hypothetical protein
MFYFFKKRVDYMSSDENVSMNKELQKWIDESTENLKDYKSKEDEPIKPSGACQICGMKKAEVVCIKCKKSVCKSCYFKIIGICKMCIPRDIAKKWDGSVSNWEKTLGIEWVE